MKWILKNGNKKRHCETLYDAADFLGYSTSYIGQKARMGQTLEGWTIEKIKPDPKFRKKYSQRELVARMEELEKIVANMQSEIDEIYESKRSYW